MVKTVEKKKIFLVDDHPLVREWLSNLINQQDDLKVCGEADDGAGLTELIGVTGADLVIVDISLKSNSGIDLIRTLRRSNPNLFIVVLSMHEESLYAQRAFRAGSRGYVMKQETTKKILIAIRRVLSGGIYVSEKFAAQMALELITHTDPTASIVTVLSDRELEIFQLLGRGIRTPLIAKQLHLSLKTVQTYCTRIKEKLHLNNGTELLREAIRWENGQFSP